MGYGKQSKESEDQPKEAPKDSPAPHHFPFGAVLEKETSIQSQ